MTDKGGRKCLTLVPQQRQSLLCQHSSPCLLVEFFCIPSFITASPDLQLEWPSVIFSGSVLLFSILAYAYVSWEKKKKTSLLTVRRRLFGPAPLFFRLRLINSVSFNLRVYIH
jgi:hypothetical protein